MTRDGRIVARKVRAYFDSGAYTRLSSYAVVKCAAHLPGPYTIPNVYADVYCVFTNRMPATAMRGFGVTAVDFAHRMPDGQARPSRRHGPDGVPHPQRLSRRRHEGAPARGQEHRADRMRAGRGGKGEMADPRRVQAHVLAQGRRRRARRRSRRRRASRSAPAARAGAAAHSLRSCRAPPPPEPPRPPPPPPAAPAAPAAPSHGAMRFSSVFGARRR